MKHIINTSEDGFSNVVEILPADKITGMIGIRFLTEWTGAEHPETQTKLTIFVTKEQYASFAATLFNMTGLL